MQLHAAMSSFLPSAGLLVDDISKCKHYVWAARVCQHKLKTELKNVSRQLLLITILSNCLDTKV